jgi:glycosyltransferase involved in cell wall biosynthesis
MEYKYLKFCKKNNKSKIIKKFKKNSNPKISIISPLFNRENYILRFIKSIHYQNFNDLEIIFIDDNSIDNSLKIIEELQNQDHRIILIKNKKNRGMFVNRNLGVLYSRGKYIILPDPDDILSKNILKVLFDLVKKYNYDLIRFSMYVRGEKITFRKFVEKLINKPIYQPELSTYVFYGSNELQTIDCYINNKFIKRKIYLKSINTLKEYYFNMYMTFMEDSIINYLLHKTSKSYLFLKKIGYYYIRNSQSITNNLFKISDLRIKFIFIYLNFLFENTKNNSYEKDINNFIFTYMIKRFNIKQKFEDLHRKPDYTFYQNIINKFLNNKYIAYNIKIILKDVQKIIKKRS